MPQLTRKEFDEELAKIEDQLPKKEQKSEYEEYLEYKREFEEGFKDSGELKLLGLREEEKIHTFSDYKDYKGKGVRYSEYNIVVEDTKTREVYVISLNQCRRWPYYRDFTFAELEVRKAKDKDFEFTAVPKKETIIKGLKIETDGSRVKQDINFQTDENGRLILDKDGVFLMETGYYNSGEINGSPDYCFDRGEYIKNNVFIYSSNGYDKSGDEEYPEGYVKINKSLFKPVNARNIEAIKRVKAHVNKNTPTKPTCKSKSKRKVAEMTI
ncbi:MAG: hypothetical protein IKO06_05935 [Alphaproteobacteria bacterium]|nr:hypothetical protein [Alphaproteobacteria bacterium]